MLWTGKSFTACGGRPVVLIQTLCDAHSICYRAAYLQGGCVAYGH